MSFRTGNKKQHKRKIGLEQLIWFTSPLNCNDHVLEPGGTIMTLVEDMINTETAATPVPTIWEQSSSSSRAVLGTGRARAPDSVPGFSCVNHLSSPLATIRGH